MFSFQQSFRCYVDAATSCSNNQIFEVPLLICQRPMATDLNSSEIR